LTSGGHTLRPGTRQPARLLRRIRAYRDSRCAKLSQVMFPIR